MMWCEAQVCISHNIVRSRIRTVLHNCPVFASVKIYCFKHFVFYSGNYSYVIAAITSLQLYSFSCSPRTRNSNKVSVTKVGIVNLLSKQVIVVDEMLKTGDCGSQYELSLTVSGSSLAPRLSSTVTSVTANQRSHDAPGLRTTASSIDSENESTVLLSPLNLRSAVHFTEHFSIRL